MENDVKKITIPDSAKVRMSRIIKTRKVLSVIETILLITELMLIMMIFRNQYKDYRTILLVQLLIVIAMSIAGHIQRHLDKKIHRIIEDVVTKAE